MRKEPELYSQPFKSLGVCLKSARQKANQSLAEVSGAVEIDLDSMHRIEQGQQRPSEEILLLLISYFNIHDDEATKMWELAGYTKEKNQTNEPDDETIKTLTSILLPDLRIIYTDIVHMSSNDHGLTMNFLQSGGVNDQPMLVSRLGMSHEHAQNILQILQNTLEVDKKTKAKLLPSPKVKKKTDTN